MRKIGMYLPVVIKTMVLLLACIGFQPMLPASAEGIRFSGNAGIGSTLDSDSASAMFLYGRVTAIGSKYGVKAKLGISSLKSTSDATYGTVGIFRRVNIAPGAYVQPMAQVVTGSSTKMILLSAKMVAPIGSATLSVRSSDNILGADLAQQLSSDLPDGLNATWLERSVDVTPKGIALILDSKIPMPFTAGLDVGLGSTGHEYLVQGGLGTTLPEIVPGTTNAQLVLGSEHNRNALIVRYTTPYFASEYQLQGVATAELRSDSTRFGMQGTVVNGPFTFEARMQKNFGNSEPSPSRYSLQMDMRF